MLGMIVKWAAFAAFAGWAAMAAPGCTHSCAEIYACPGIDMTGGGSGAGGTGGAGGGDTYECPDDPSDGFVADECGVWVSASLGDDSQAGTQAKPVRTMVEAIQRAQAGTGRVYACGETYVGAIVLPSGISLAGGFACGKRAWSYAGKDRPARVVSMVPGEVALTLLAGETPSLLTDLEVEAADAEAPGGSSIAVLSLGARATILRSHLIAGDGVDGIDGEPGDHDGAPAKKGLPGKDGESACMLDIGPGGASVELQCEAGAVSSTGGEGGDGGAAAANDGSAGQLPPDPNPLGYGAGGKGEDALLGTACTGGTVGAQGVAGPHGLGATGKWQITQDGYVGEPGGNGFPGTPGQGGGGGGGSIGSALCGAKKGGAGGGSGGTGGCGGKAGQGGGPGGSSFGLAIVANVVRVHDVRITTGNGGRGGNGGSGQQGGQAGFPGLPGKGFGGAGGVKWACAGGAGGSGGNGGHGGGGLGGHSLGAVAAPGAHFEQISPVNFVYGVGGQGGKGGNPAIEPTNGSDGMIGGYFPLLP